MSWGRYDIRQAGQGEKQQQSPVPDESERLLENAYHLFVTRQL